MSAAFSTGFIGDRCRLQLLEIQITICIHIEPATGTHALRSTRACPATLHHACHSDCEMFSEWSEPVKDAIYVCSILLVVLPHLQARIPHGTYEVPSRVKVMQSMMRMNSMSTLYSLWRRLELAVQGVIGVSPTLLSQAHASRWPH